MTLNLDLRHTQAHRLMGRPTTEPQKPADLGATGGTSRSKRYRELQDRSSGKGLYLENKERKEVRHLAK